MELDRRSFLKTSVVGAGVVAGLGAAGLPAGTAAPAAASAARPKAVLKLSSQEGRLPGRGFADKVKNLVKYGGAGIELHPGICDANRRKEMMTILKDHNVGVSAICAADGPYIIPDEAERQKKIDNCKRILDAAGEMGSTGVIIVPAFNGAKNALVGWEARELLIKVLKELGPHAEQAKTRVLLEPLNRGEARFLRQVGDAASICRDVNHPGIALMGDFFHMRIEEPDDAGAFISAGPWLHHVHLASWDRNLPGQDKRSFVNGFRGLKWIGYQDYCSLECGCKGNPEEEIPKSFAFLKQQWEEATVG